MELRPTGATDFKVSCSKMVKSMLSIAQIGPTHENKLPAWRVAAGAEEKSGEITLLFFSFFFLFYDLTHTSFFFIFFYFFFPQEMNPLTKFFVGMTTHHF